MLISRIMRQPVTVVSPDTSVRAAAALMQKLNIGALPVCQAMRPIGLVTDRDIAIRWAPELMGDCPISRIMTPNAITCRDDQTIERVAHILSDAQIRRLIVVNGAGEIVGMATLGDIARDASEELAGQTLGEIVEDR